MPPNTPTFFPRSTTRLSDTEVEQLKAEIQDHLQEISQFQFGQVVQNNTTVYYSLLPSGEYQMLLKALEEEDIETLVNTIINLPQRFKRLSTSNVPSQNRNNNLSMLIDMGQILELVNNKVIQLAKPNRKRRSPEILFSDNSIDKRQKTTLLSLFHSLTCLLEYTKSLTFLTIYTSSETGIIIEEPFISDQYQQLEDALRQLQKGNTPYISNIIVYIEAQYAFLVAGLGSFFKDLSQICERMKLPKTFEVYKQERIDKLNDLKECIELSKSELNEYLQFKQNNLSPTDANQPPLLKTPPIRRLAKG